MKTYRKTATIQAEQFDGSSKMIIKYKLYVPSGEFISPHRPMYLMYALEGPTGVNVGDFKVSQMSNSTRRKQSIVIVNYTNKQATA